MSKSKNNKRPVKSGDMIVLSLVVIFIFIFALSAVMVDILPDPDITQTPSSTASHGEYPTLYAKEVRAAAEKYGIEEERIYAIITVESDFRKDCISSADARGLMQMLPATYKFVCERRGTEYRVEDLFDPAVNIDAGTYYLKYIYDKYNDWNHTYAAYNAGYGNVNKWLKNEEYTEDGKLITEKIPFKETRNYVKKVNYYYNEYKLAKAYN